MTKRVEEEDYPSRAEYAAALNWRQIIAETGFYPTPGIKVQPREHGGWFGNTLIKYVGAADDNFFAQGAWLFWTIILLCNASMIAALAFLLYSPGLVSISLLIAAVLLLPAVHSISTRVLLFRAGGWVAMLEQRDKRREKRRQDKNPAAIPSEATE